MPAPTTQTASDSAEFLSRLKAFEVPSQGEIVTALQQMGWLQAVLLVAAGLVYMLQGWKIFKVLVVVNAAVLGGMLGAWIGGMLEGENTWLLTGIAGAVLLAVIAMPAMKYAVSVMGALAGSIVGFAAWKYVATAAGQPDVAYYAWVGALIGLITLGLLAFVIFRFVIVTFTSFQGAAMVVSGILAMAFKSPRLGEPLRAELMGNIHLLPLLVVVPAAIGFTFQHSAAAMAKKRKRSD
jgi:hypothetical protein